MEYLCGKQSGQLDRAALMTRLADYRQVWLDLGTGDGRFVARLAQAQPDTFVIGLDACRENLREVARRARPNALYVIANALSMPAELTGLAHRVTINFPWGSLLDGLLQSNLALLDGLRAAATETARLEVCLNASALRQAGWASEEAQRQLQAGLESAGFKSEGYARLERADLKAFPSSWARRLASDPQAQAYRLCSSKVVSPMAYFYK